MWLIFGGDSPQTLLHLGRQTKADPTLRVEGDRSQYPQDFEARVRHDMTDERVMTT